ncbi:lysoplasmalogenase [Photobacterium sp. 1_MG-2023]|uniref:lysoplasmalogenase n=1 Tax=Photobacterium sp. 1_MG-2023 TaxID=3062646 RepID=UPI0026E2CF02|nr:lysoplasmalogenase [Photobacterium sp. 1_MG-2023]MDO6708511.1 lysoplasmalogenase [Photobacterium sp. 1_MG-2023]
MWVWLAVSFSALLHINAAYRGPQWQFYLFKPLTIVLLLATTIQFGPSELYQKLIIAGLLCSVVGDICLMLPKDRFVAGLASFLLAHVIYSVAFWGELAGPIVWWLPALLGGAGIIVYLLLLPSLGRLAVPVAVYIAVILQMTWAAGEYWLTTRTGAGLAAFAGALIFLISDTLLALDRFRGRFAAATGSIMTTYYLSQALLVISVLLR